MKIVKSHNHSYQTIDNQNEVKEVYSKYALEFERVVLKIRDNFIGCNISYINSNLIRSIGYSNKYSTTNNTYNNLYYSNQLNLAWYKYAMNEDKPITIHIADKTIETIGKFEAGDYFAVSSHFTLAGFYTSIILRDTPTQLFFSDISLDFIDTFGQEDNISETMVMFYQLLVKGIGTKDEAQGAYYHITQNLNWEEYRQYIKIEGYKSEYIWKEVLFKNRVRTATSIFLPVLNIYHQIFHQNQSGYEQAVYEALLKWKEHWTLKYLDENQEEWDLSTEPEGYIALPIIAACAYAYDRGMKLETVESDYLPKWMIEGKFDNFELLIQ